MKKILLMMLLLASMAGNAQERKYSTFYYQRATLFEHVKNRGISGDICMGVYDRLDAILKGKPAKIFLLIGINDVSRGTSADTIVNRIGMITQKIKQDSPKTKLYLQSVLPVTDHYKMFGGHTSRWQEVKKINEGLM